MAHTIIRHQVEDFGTWKEHFDSTADLRREQGEESWNIYQDDDDPNDVTVVTSHRDADSATSWIGSDRFHEKMVAGGVIGEPEIRFLNQA